MKNETFMHRLQYWESKGLTRMEAIEILKVEELNSISFGIKKLNDKLYNQEKQVNNFSNGKRWAYERRNQKTWW